MNSVFIDGNLTKDPTLGYTERSKPFVKFTIANNTWYKGEKQTQFIDCMLWGDQAKRFCELAKKGTRVMFDEATLRSSAWTDKEGKRRMNQEVHCFRFTLMGFRKPQEGDDLSDDTPY